MAHVLLLVERYTMCLSFDLFPLRNKTLVFDDKGLTFTMHELQG